MLGLEGIGNADLSANHAIHVLRVVARYERDRIYAASEGLTRYLAYLEETKGKVTCDKAGTVGGAIRLITKARNCFNRSVDWWNKLLADRPRLQTTLLFKVLTGETAIHVVSESLDTLQVRGAVLL